MAEGLREMERGGCKNFAFYRNDFISSARQSGVFLACWFEFEVRNKGILIKIPKCQKFYLFLWSSKCINQIFAQPAINFFVRRKKGGYFLAAPLKSNCLIVNTQKSIGF